MLRPWLFLFLLSGTLAFSFIKENVVFEKVNEITTTRSKWLVAFVIDIDPYSSLLARINASIQAVENKLFKVAFTKSQDQSPMPRRLSNILNLIAFEKNNFEKIKDFLWQELSGIHSLHKVRSKRSLIPIVGKALSFLFGTLSESDLSAIKNNVRTLARNQVTLQHVVNASLTVLKTVQGQTVNNTRTINSIIDFIERLERSTKNITVNLARIGKQMDLYTMFDRALTEIQTLVDMARDHAQNLKLQLNMLSLGHLSPAVISPTDLRKLLFEVGNQLGRQFRFPFDPEKDLWTFYKTLTCTTLIENNQLVVVISIPLLDNIGTFEVYKVFNLPLPQNFSSNQSHILARYDLESRAMMINKRRTQFALLTSAEIESCSSSLRPYCTIRNPVYSILSSRMCILQIFLGQMEKIEQFCKILVTPNAPTPQARYLTDGHWVITSAVPLSFNVLCNTTSSTTKVITTTPPIDIIFLDLACSAFNGHMTLLPFFHKESKYDLSAPFKTFLNNFKFGLINVWKSFDISLPDFGQIKIPPKLKETKEIPLDNLIFELKNSKSDIEPMPADTPLYYYWIGGIMIGIILVILFCFRRRLQNYFSKFKICPRSIKRGTVEDPECPAPTRPDQPDVQHTVPMRQENDCVPQRHQQDERLSADYLREKYKIFMSDDPEVKQTIYSTPWTDQQWIELSSLPRKTPVVNNPDGRSAYRLIPKEHSNVNKSPKQKKIGEKDAEKDPFDNDARKEVAHKADSVTSGISVHDVAVRPDVKTSPSLPQVNVIPQSTVKTIYPKINVKE